MVVVVVAVVANLIEERDGHPVRAVLEPRHIHDEHLLDQH